jgi:hypothetical protein
VWFRFAAWRGLGCNEAGCRRELDLAAMVDDEKSSHAGWYMREKGT